MALRFRKISDRHVDDARVTLRLSRADDGSIVGRVSTLALGSKGVELMSTAMADSPAEVAIKLARDLAKFKETDVDVIDPDDLWQEEWGRLR